MEAADGMDYDTDVSHGIDVRRYPALLSRIVPPEGTDIRAVQGVDDPAPIVVGTLLIQ